MPSLRRLSLLLLVFQLSACVELFPPRPEPVNLAAGSGFPTLLAAEYNNLATFAGEEMVDPAEAQRFLSKSKAAASGKPVFADNPDNARVSSTTRAELIRAHEVLADALANLNAPQNDALLAMAQSHYDCWIFTAEHNRSDRIDLPCHNDFEQSIEYLSVPDNDMYRFDIKFPPGMASVDMSAMKIARAAADHYRDRALWTILLSGYSEAKKPGRETVDNLTMRRTIAVKNALAQQGIGDERVLIQVGDAPEEEPGLAGSVAIDFVPDYTEAGLELKSRPAPGWDHGDDY